ncbi:MAG: hypothetical protein ACKOUT_06365 [Novosphingobium sp.]
MKPIATVAVLAFALLTAGCGSSDGGASSAVAEAATGTSALCENLPPHVALPADARISLCTRNESSPGHRSGAILLSTEQAPDAIIAFYKAKARQAGIPDSVSNTSPRTGMGPMYSAREGTKRSFMVMTRPIDGGRTEVTLNWGADK